MRTQKELILATKPFCVEDRAESWRLLLLTFAVVASMEVLIISVPFLAAKVALSCILGVVWVRVFIFYHDWAHKAVLHKSKLGSIIMHIAGFYTLVPATVWRETHDYHHINNTRMMGASIGSYPLITVGMFKGLSPENQRFYAFARHPLTILFTYLTLFVGGMCISAFRRAPKDHWQGPFSLFVHFGTVALIAWFYGFTLAVLTLSLPVAIANTVGAYLFYAQHNFPEIKLKGRREWSYAYAALHSSSMMDMPDIMHWMTGNIGYHHVHHLNHKIPFYKLHLAMEAIPELRNPGRTNLSVSEIVACLSLKLWDPKLDRMVTWAEAAEQLNGETARSGV